MLTGHVPEKGKVSEIHWDAPGCSSSTVFFALMFHWAPIWDHGFILHETLRGSILGFQKGLTYELQLLYRCALNTEIHIQFCRNHWENTDCTRAVSLPSSLEWLHLSCTMIHSIFISNGVDWWNPPSVFMILCASLKLTGPERLWAVTQARSHHGPACPPATGSQISHLAGLSIYEY